MRSVITKPEHILHAMFYQLGITDVWQLIAADFRRGFLVTLINPKAIVFYMAFFPLFIGPTMHRGSVTFLAMGAIICSCTLLYGSFLVCVGNAAAKRLAGNRRIASFASRAAGIFLIGFGIKLTTN